MATTQLYPVKQTGVAQEPTKARGIVKNKQKKNKKQENIFKKWKINCTTHHKPLHLIRLIPFSTYSSPPALSHYLSLLLIDIIYIIGSL